MLAPSQPLDSFSAVCTEPCHREMALAIYSIRRFYHQPILIICDDATDRYLGQFTFKDVIRRVEANPQAIKDIESAVAIRTHNTFHSRGAIYKKMDAIAWAVNTTGSTMFIDADIVLMSEIHMDITHPVMLSPHYHTEERHGENRKYGGFNAGYVYVSDVHLAEAWREIYLRRSRFYEQEGMAFLFEDFDIGKFSWFHNIGFWRNTHPAEPELPFDDALVRSIHCHFDTAAYAKANKGLAKAYDNWQEYWRERVPDYITTFIGDIL